MKTRLSIPISFMFAVIFAIPAVAAPTYVLDPSQTTLSFRVKKFGGLSEVVGRFGRFQTKTFQLDLSHPENSAFEIWIDVDSLSTRENFPAGISKTSPDRDQHLRSKDFFDVAHHRFMVFKSLNIRKLNPRHVVMQGELTIRGVHHVVKLDVESASGTQPNSPKLRMFAKTGFNRKSFGMTWNRTGEALAKATMVGDDVAIELNLMAVRKDVYEQEEQKRLAEEKKRLESLARAQAQALTPREKARRLFERLTGVPIAANDLRLLTMEGYVQAGWLMDAAAIATDDDDFINVTLRKWASRMANRDEDPTVPVEDFQALFMGAARDDLDARTVLSGDYSYFFSEKFFDSLSALHIYTSQEKVPENYVRVSAFYPNYKQGLEKIKASKEIPAAGVFSTDAWARAHYDAGTNRRSVEYAFKEFLCTPIDQFKDASLPDDFVRQDVDRLPGGNPATYQKQCRACHAPMDALAGAFAHFDYKPKEGDDPFSVGNIIFSKDILPKYLQNNTTYPEGHRTFDDAWVNLLGNNHTSFGWRGPVRGHGPKDFGKMIAESQAFKTCMAKRAFKEVCNRDPLPSDAPEIHQAAEVFEQSGYRIKRLFQRVAVAPQCLSSPVPALKDFLQYYESLRLVMGLDRPAFFKEPLQSQSTFADGQEVEPKPYGAEMDAVFQKVVGQLPRHGLLSELSSPALMSYTSLAGQACQLFVDKEIHTREHDQRRAHRTYVPLKRFEPAYVTGLVQEYFQLFYQRAARPDEAQPLVETLLDLKNHEGLEAPRVLQLLCTVVASSMDFIKR